MTRAETPPPSILPEGYAIRLGTLEDCEVLQEIERAAARAFVGRKEMGETDIDLNRVTPLAFLEARVGEGLLWTLYHGKAPAGYIVCSWVKTDFYIAEVDVHPDHGGKALGAVLIERAAAHGFANGAARITLSTFTEIPWNRPYYERLGFAVLPEAEWTRFMRENMARQGEDGLDISMRCFMARAS